MSPSDITSQQIKLAILKYLSTTYYGDYKYNIIGKFDAPIGTIEHLLKVRFNNQERHLASKCFDELRSDDLIRPTYSDSVDPENWVVIIDAGLEALNKGTVDRLNINKGKSAEDGGAAVKVGRQMNERLRRFLDELAKTRGRAYYHPESNDEASLRKFQGEVDEIRDLEKIDVLKIVSKHQESSSGHDYVDLIRVELTGAGVKWLNSPDTVASADNQDVEAKPKAVGIAMASDPRNVFVVHGRNLEARNSLFRFLRAIGLRPLEWSQAIQETGKASPFIGNVLDAAFSMAQAVVVLLTPDDEARLREPFRSPSDSPHESQLTGQARPNVLFEAGMAMGHNPDRAVIVELGIVRPFSDIAGRHTVLLSNDSAARQELAQRLETAGCAVDLSGRDWHTEGDFNLQHANLQTAGVATPLALPAAVKAEHVSPSESYDVADILSMISVFIDSKRSGNNRFLIRYSDVDKEFGFDKEITKMHIEEAARRSGYRIEENGETTILLRMPIGIA